MKIFKQKNKKINFLIYLSLLSFFVSRCADKSTEEEALYFFNSGNYEEAAPACRKVYTTQPDMDPKEFALYLDCNFQSNASRAGINTEFLFELITKLDRIDIDSKGYQTIYNLVNEIIPKKTGLSYIEESLDDIILYQDKFKGAPDEKTIQSMAIIFITLASTFQIKNTITDMKEAIETKDFKNYRTQLENYIKNLKRRFEGMDENAVIASIEKDEQIFGMDDKYLRQIIFDIVDINIIEQYDRYLHYMYKILTRDNLINIFKPFMKYIDNTFAINFKGHTIDLTFQLSDPEPLKNLLQRALSNPNFYLVYALDSQDIPPEEIVNMMSIFEGISVLMMQLMNKKAKKKDILLLIEENIQNFPVLTGQVQMAIENSDTKADDDANFADMINISTEKEWTETRKIEVEK